MSPIRSMLWRIQQFLANADGTIAVIFAIAMPALICVAGVAIDYAVMTNIKANLQAAADGAAIAGAKELALANAAEKQVEAAATRWASVQGMDERDPMEISVAIARPKGKVSVELAQNWRPFFAHFVGIAVTPVRARASAQLLSKATNICVLTLKPSGAKGIHLDHDAAMQAGTCGVYANSTDSEAIRLDKSTKIHAGAVCSAGGYYAESAADIQPEPLTDCSAIPDPLEARPAPAFGSCDHENFKADSGNVTLSPGVYCGGIEISGTAQADFDSGVYVINDGPLKFADAAQVTGTDVGFYLTGGNALIEFIGDASVRLSGPESGTLAGLLFFEDRASDLARKHMIRSTQARELVGTIYLPRGILAVDPNADVALDSAYTAIIAYELALAQAPVLHLNSDYQATDVPVPEGILRTGTVVLTD